MKSICHGTKAPIAIVDDDETSLLLLKEFLERNGFEIECFSEAESLLTSDPERFGAILLDLNLPGMWGSECVWKLRMRQCTCNIIAISGNLECWKDSDLRDVGFSHTLGKPLVLEKLLILLRNENG